MRILVVVILAVVTALGACEDRPKPKPQGDLLNKAANQAVEYMDKGKLPMGVDVWGEPAAVFGRHTVPANTAINAPEYTVEYLIRLERSATAPHWVGITISRRFDRGAGDYVSLSRDGNGAWRVMGHGNFELTLGVDVDTEGGDYERRKKYLVEVFSAADRCARSRSC